MLYAVIVRERRRNEEEYSLREMKGMKRMMRTIYLDATRRLSLFNVCLLAATGISILYILTRNNLIILP